MLPRHGSTFLCSHVDDMGVEVVLRLHGHWFGCLCLSQRCWAPVFSFVVRVVGIEKKNPVNIGLQGFRGGVEVVGRQHGCWCGCLCLPWMCWASVHCFVVRVVKNEKNPVNVGLQGLGGEWGVTVGGHGCWCGHLHPSWMCQVPVFSFVVRVAGIEKNPVNIGLQGFRGGMAAGVAVCACHGCVGHWCAALLSE